MSSEARFGRRGALVGIGLAATGAAAIPSLVQHGVGPRRDVPRDSGDPHERPDAASAHGLSAADDGVQALFGELREGRAIEGHWTIEARYGVRAGAIPVVMSSLDGSRFALEVFRADDGGPAPLARAGALALYLVNRGDGRSSTPEHAGLGVLALARALSARLAEGAPVPAALSTHAERRVRHPNGVFHVPLA